MITAEQSHQLRELIDDVMCAAVNEEWATHRGYSYEQEEAENDAIQKSYALEQFILTITERADHE